MPLASEINIFSSRTSSSSSFSFQFTIHFIHTSRTNNKWSVENSLNLQGHNFGHSLCAWVCMCVHVSVCVCESFLWPLTLHLISLTALNTPPSSKSSDAWLNKSSLQLVGGWAVRAAVGWLTVAVVVGCCWLLVVVAVGCWLLLLLLCVADYLSL